MTTTLAAPTDLGVTRQPSSWVVAARIARLLADRTLSDRSAWVLPVSALAIVSALTLSVAGGVRWFNDIEGRGASFYQPMSWIALVLLLIPLATLAGAAARLAASRRDTRLSSLRLLGATTTTVRALTLIETGVIALVGALIGVVGHLLLMPVFGLLHFNGGPIGPTGLWLGPGPLALGVLGIVALALVSSALGLRQVEISPLGVRTRQRAPRLHWLRVVVGGVAIIASILVMQNLAVLTEDVATMLVFLLVAMSVPMLAINLIGPWVLSLLARIDVARARTPVALLAARTVLDNPKAVWRQVGGLALISFVSVFIGVAFTFATGTASNPEEVVINTDLRTGALLTLAIAFVTVACSVGITQAAAILDRRALQVGLDMLGMPVAAIDAARRRAVMRPLVAVVAMSAGPALLLVLPLAGFTQTFDPLSLGTTLAVLAIGVGLVALSLRITRRTLHGVIAEGLARAE
ncbi:MAG: ABC transporter permease [Propionibacteriaceae bacterium]|nr:ABC transporter permease [Propionibacteriaceae bacterium]